MANFISSLTSALASSNPPEKIKMWLIQESEELQLPILPSSFELSVQNNNSTLNINSIGELNMMGKTGLKSISIDSFFPAQNYGFCICSPDRTPYEYIKTIEDWRTSEKPVRFLIAGTDINILCLIENLSYSEKDGARDVYYGLSLKEYKILNDVYIDKSIDTATGILQRPDNRQLLPVTIFPDSMMMDQAIRLDPNNYLSVYKKLAKRSVPLKAGEIISLTKLN